MGESCIRGNVSHGDGVYRSTDAGRTWTHLGLEDTRHIAKVRVHPTNPDLVYVAALGHALRTQPGARRVPLEGRRARRGSRSCSAVENAGAIDLSMDPHNPRVLYAAFWEARRTPWSLTSGGPGSGLFKSTDGGDTWTEISPQQGLPRADSVLGKIGVCASGARPDRVCAIVEAEDGGRLPLRRRRRDLDAGCQRRARTAPARLVLRPRLRRPTGSGDCLGPRTSETWKSHRRRADLQRLRHPAWRQPRPVDRPPRSTTHDRGQRWRRHRHVQRRRDVVVDLQPADRAVLSRHHRHAVPLPAVWRAARQHAHQRPQPLGEGRDYAERMLSTIGGGESGYIAVRPDNPNIIFAGQLPGGYLTRLRPRHRAGAAIDHVWPEDLLGGGAKDARSIAFSGRSRSCCRHTTRTPCTRPATHVFRSTDEGISWKAISPDLTRNDVSKLEPSGGPITKDNTGAEVYCTIFASPSRHSSAGLFWAGSDDGLVHISRDSGKTLAERDAAGPARMGADQHDRGVAARSRRRVCRGDALQARRLCAVRSSRRLTTAHPGRASPRASLKTCSCAWCAKTRRAAGSCTRVPKRACSCRTTTAAAGGRPKGNLPTVPIHDLVVKQPEGDLVLATHGRSFWIYDDLGPIRQLPADLDEHRRRWSSHDQRCAT